MADQAGVNQVSVDLNDIMDVVTMYKCKFCSFSCGQPEGIGQHVQQTHVLSDLKRTDSTIPQLTVSTSTSDHSIQTGETESVTLTVQPQTKTASRSLLRRAGASSGITQSMLEVNETQETRTHLDGADRLIEAASMQPVETVMDVSQVAEAAAEGLAINKEIYLCGQCNLGFDSMENCKNHMIRDHNIMLEQEEEEQEEVGTEVQVPGEVTLPANKVSVGTQVMTRKKPGRKRKIKVEPAAQMSVEEEFAEEMAQTEPQLPEPDALPEDYGPAEEVSTRDEEEEDENGMPRRRRRRLPTRLSSLYYMGKRSPTRSQVKHQPPARIKVEPHKLRCPKAGCNARFRTQTSVDLHLACHRNETEGGGRREVFGCPRCEVTNPQWKVLRAHLWKDHAIDTDLYACDKCDFKVDTLFRLERHAQIHSEARPYVCTICGKGFKQASQLHNHKGIHADRSEPNKWYSNKQCDICMRTFANQKSLKIHIESVHSKERPFVCPYCNHATSRKAILDLHVRTHTGEKPFKCDMCTYMTGDHNSLRRHKMRHTGEKPYKCRYCPYSAIQAISLKTHMKNKHPGYEGIFACSLCTYQTVNEGYYNQHMLDHKNNLVPTVRTAPRQTAQQPVVQGSPRVSRPPPPLLRAAPALQPGVITIAPSNQQALTVSAPLVAGTHTIAASELSKLASIGSVLQGDSNTAQLIYSALNALSQQQQQGAGGQDQPNQQQAQAGASVLAQPSVQSSTQDGVTTHTITFHIPPEVEVGEGGVQVVQEEVMEVEREVQQEEGVSEMVISEDGAPVLLAVQPTQHEHQPQTSEQHREHQEQQLVVSEAQGQQLVVSEAQGQQLVVSETEGQQIVVSEAQGQQLVVSETQGQQLVVSETQGQQLVVSEAQGQQLVVSEAQGQQLVVSESQGQQEPLIVSEGTEVTYTTEVQPDALHDHMVMVETVAETTPTEEVSTYEATPSVTIHTEENPPTAEVAATTEVVAELGGGDEVVTQVDLGDTIIMEVVDEDGNVKEQEVQYCTIAREGE